MKVVILEDETLASDKLIATLNELGEDYTIAAVIKSVEKAVEWFTSNDHPDLILSDIRLLDGISFEIFQQVSIQTPVVFTTAYDQYAIKAFEVNSIDYLLKPVQKEKLKASLDKLKERTPQSTTAPSLSGYEEMLNFFRNSQASYKSRFMVKVGQKIVAVTIDKVAYFYSENKLTFLITADGKRYPLDTPLEELITQLDPKVFFRANRQYVVRFESIAEIHPYFKGRVMIMLNPKTEGEVVISADRTPAFKKWLDQ